MKPIKEQSLAELNETCSAVRAKIIDAVSHNGGHLTSSLGAVELITAMHYVFDPQSDPFIFDVSHQAYAHKLLTDRWDRFETLRSFGGISGFTKPKESPFDYFVAGHSSTSISVAVGAAKAIALKGETRAPVALIGDGALSAGMVYEALNELGDRKYPMVIIINDNEMSIARPIGAISLSLSNAIAAPWFQKIKSMIDGAISGNETFQYLAKRFEESLRLITPGILFEELGLDYIGPVNGHDLSSLIPVLTRARAMKKPVVVHARTIKGKGYDIAQGKQEHWHGVGPFDKESGRALKSGGEKSATAIYSEALLNLARENDKIVGVTAAMPSGTGLDKLIEEFPNRFWDVAIAEQHAVTSCAALAKEGFKPFCTIYSTFLQRGYDQIIHDCAIGALPVVFAVDRAGIVGEDGETHQGAFDVGFLRLIPNMVVFAPRDEASLIDAVRFAAALDKPCSFRYPRGSFGAQEAPFEPFELGKAQWLRRGEKLLLIGYGSGAAKALKVHNILAQNGVNAGVLDLRFVKPIDKTALAAAAENYERFAVISDSSVTGGVSGAIMEALVELDRLSVKIERFELPDEFLRHGATRQVEESLGLSAEQIAKRLLNG
ncbi:MAG: 1-deoxy-D-xylulose-5-phosphate synthase [Helicobacteraceae bacterium]|jgi:1-deoxy-D-xylulose-5-phosphate synthase|nr:1-deoxy-D-xylulose-5-phosphate synthase [Helicobacteraceae bacterium]